MLSKCALTKENLTNVYTQWIFLDSVNVNL